MGARYMQFAFLFCRPCSVTPCCRKFGHQVLHLAQKGTSNTQAVQSLTLGKALDTTRGIGVLVCGLSQKLPLGFNAFTVKRLCMQKKAGVLEITRVGRIHTCAGDLNPAKSTISYSQMQKRCMYLSVDRKGKASLTPFHSTSTAVARDVVLFEHDRTRFFRLLTVFCVSQVLFWTYLAHFAFTSVRDTKSGGKKADKDVEAGDDGGIRVFGLTLGTNTWRFGFTLSCLAVGGAIAGLGLLLTRRSVSRIVLHKGGGMVTVTTQSPFGTGKGRNVRVPLSHVTCHSHWTEAPYFIPLRVKGHRFYFLLDRDGKLNNIKLFEITVGAYRQF